MTASIPPDHILIESKDSDFSFVVPREKIQNTFLLNYSRSEMTEGKKKIILPFSLGVIKHLKKYFDSEFEDSWNGVKKRSWFNIPCSKRIDPNDEPVSLYSRIDTNIFEAEDWNGKKQWFGVPVECISEESKSMEEEYHELYPVAMARAYQDLHPIEIEDLETIGFLTFISEYFSPAVRTHILFKEAFVLVPGHNGKIYPTLFFFLCLSEFLSVPFSFSINGGSHIHDKDFLVKTIKVHGDFKIFRNILRHHAKNK
jgi:hypothetical protein